MNPPDSTARKDFLLKMYEQTFKNIDRSINVIWQSVGVLIGAFALFSLSEKNLIPLDVAISLIILVAFWLIAHVYESSEWYNRNILITSNIEKQFLTEEDLHLIHYFFGRQRRVKSMVGQLSLQRAFAIGIIIIVISYHFIKVVYPGIGGLWSTFDPGKSLPYLILIISYFALILRIKNANKCYADLKANSPGKLINSVGIKYGVGHPVDKEKNIIKIIKMIKTLKRYVSLCYRFIKL